MSDKQSGVYGAVAVAAVLSLVINALRLLGELQHWETVVMGKNLFSTEALGGGSLLGITFLVPIFGFWFGRRLAKTGSRPTATGKAVLLHLLGIALMAGAGYLALETELIDGWKARGLVAFLGAAVFGLLAFKAFPKAYLANVLYGLLARAPVVLVQFVAIRKGWDTHFSKAPPMVPTDPDSVLFALTLAQSTLWPFGFTALVGGLFATLGAASVRK
ncbi:MAG: hypothetical protein ABL997_09445 [Planctomycetota bacterium]